MLIYKCVDLWFVTIGWFSLRSFKLFEKGNHNPKASEWLNLSWWKKDQRSFPKRDGNNKLRPITWPHECQSGLQPQDHHKDSYICITMGETTIVTKWWQDTQLKKINGWHLQRQGGEGATFSKTPFLLQYHLTFIESTEKDFVHEE